MADGKEKTFDLGKSGTINRRAEERPRENGALTCDELRDRRVFAQTAEIIHCGQLWPITHRVHHAQESERFILVRPELMPCQRWDMYEVMFRDVVDAITDQAAAAATLDEDRVRMLVALECRVTSGRHLEITQLAGEQGVVEKHLSRDLAKRCTMLPLVFEHFDFSPTHRTRSRAVGWSGHVWLLLSCCQLRAA